MCPVQFTSRFVTICSFCIHWQVAISLWPFTDKVRRKNSTYSETSRVDKMWGFQWLLFIRKLSDICWRRITAGLVWSYEDHVLSEHIQMPRLHESSCKAPSSHYNPSCVPPTNICSSNRTFLACWPSGSTLVRMWPTNDSVGLGLSQWTALSNSCSQTSCSRYTFEHDFMSLQEWSWARVWLQGSWYSVHCYGQCGGGGCNSTESPEVWPRH